MQSDGRVQTPPLSHYTPSSRQHNSYSSSSGSSYRLQNHSRSESGTSQTNYDDPLATPPPPRALMEEYTRTENHINASPKLGISGVAIDAALRDPMTMHLLLEDAVDDSQHFEIISPEELKLLKKEQTFLTRRIESAKKKLSLESRVLNTAQSLQRLDSKPTFKYNPRSSLGKRRSSGGSETILGASGQEDLGPLTKKCEDLAHEIWKLEKRLAEVQDRCLRHTAGVLKLNFDSQAQGTQFQRSVGLDGYDREDDEDDYPQLESMDDAIDRFGTPQNLKPRLQALNSELYDLISKSGPYAKAGYTNPPGPDAYADDELTYVEMGLNTVKGLHEGLAKYSEQSVEKVRRYEQINAVVTGLWETVCAGESNLKRSKQAAQTSAGGERGLEDDDSSDDDADEDEGFSIQAFSSRVQRLCERAATLSERHETITRDMALTRETRNLVDSAELMSEREAREEDARAHELDREEMEAEIVRLQTELTVSRAELDGAYGTRAQRAFEGQAKSGGDKELEELIAKNSDLMQQKAEIEQRVDILQKELRELVTEHESLAKQGVEAEKDRESLEGLVDSLKERIEEVEVKLGDEKVKAMGKANGKPTNGETARGGPTISVESMRGEFKKMMRDAKTEHFRSLRAEQEERRRLEAIIRNLRKEQSSGSSATLSPPPHAKSSLSRSVAAS